MKILIIGSKGFIGSHALHYFSQNNQVYGVDIINDYNSTNYYLIDSTNADYHFIFQSKKFDICINCSGAASVPQSIENPLRDFELNVNNVFKILSAIKKYNPQCRFINLSSAAVYGNPQKLPINENAPLKPLSPYGKHKYLSEQILKEFYEMFQIPTLSFRIFSAYGENLEKQIFWDLHKKAMDTDTVELWGTGNETRDFIYVKDLVKLMELAVENAEFKGESINIANGEEISIKKAAQLFYQFYKPEIKLIFNNKVRPGDPLNWHADISIIKSWGYKPAFSLYQGLKNYVKWLKKE